MPQAFVFSGRVSAMSRVPPEIWESIFFTALEVAHSGNMHGTLALVCRFWKDVLYKSERLWQRVDLTHTTRAHLHLRLAGSYPIHVEWSLRRNSQDEDISSSLPPSFQKSKYSFHEELGLLRDHSATVQELSITGLQPDLHLRLNNFTFSCLRVFRWDAPTPSQPWLSPMLCRVHAPCLCDITLS